MRVFANSSKTFLVAAALHNIHPEPESGPNNVVAFGVLTTDGIQRVGVSRDAVVNVTGPGD
jgi:hypothetical protein